MVKCTCDICGGDIEIDLDFTNNDFAFTEFKLTSEVRGVIVNKLNDNFKNICKECAEKIVESINDTIIDLNDAFNFTGAKKLKKLKKRPLGDAL